MPKFGAQDALQSNCGAKMCSCSSKGEKRGIWGISGGFEIWLESDLMWLRSEKNQAGMISDELSAYQG